MSDNEIRDHSVVFITSITKTRNKKIKLKHTDKNVIFDLFEIPQKLEYSFCELKEPLLEQICRALLNFWFCLKWSL